MTTKTKKTVKPRRVRDPELVRTRVLDAVTKAFAMYGFEGATMPKIAAAGKVSTPLIVHHFKSKRLLWRATFERLASSSSNTLKTLAEAPGLSAGERLRQIVAFQVQFFATTPAIYQIIANEAHYRSERMTWICDRFARAGFEAVVKTIRQAQADGEVRALSAERLRYVIIQMASISGISAEYQYLTGRDPRKPTEVAATIDFINSLIFIDKDQTKRK